MKLSINKYLFILGLILLVGCSKMDEYKQLFTNGEELKYAEKTDSLQVFSGRNRVQLSWMPMTDPMVEKAKIYWNNRSDSLEADIAVSSGQSPVNSVFIDLAEGAYSFEVYTFDKLGNKSVPAFATGRSYGERYEVGLLNRVIESAELNQEGDVLVQWGISDQSIGNEIKYLTSSDEEVTVSISAEEESTTLLDYKRGVPFTYQTFFKPDTNAIDVFYAPMAYQNVRELLDKSRFRDVTFPGDSPAVEGNSNVKKEYLWDDRWSTDYKDPYVPAGWRLFQTDGPINEPAVFSLDLGVTAKLDKFRLSHYWDFINFGPREYEVWGSADPDGSWDSWVELGYFNHGDGYIDESLKPGIFLNGDIIEISPEQPPVRYIRFKGIRNWQNNGGQVAIAELTFWGEVIQIH